MIPLPGSSDFQKKPKWFKILIVSLSVPVVSLLLALCATLFLTSVVIGLIGAVGLFVAWPVVPLLAWFKLGAQSKEDAEEISRLRKQIDELTKNRPEE